MVVVVPRVVDVVVVDGLVVEEVVVVEVTEELQSCGQLHLFSPGPHTPLPHLVQTNPLSGAFVHVLMLTMIGVWARP